MGVALLRAALLALLLAAPALAGGGEERLERAERLDGSWVAPDLRLNLTRRGDRLVGTLQVGAKDRIAVEARVSGRKLSGTLTAGRRSVTVTGGLGHDALELRVDFGGEPASDRIRYYELRRPVLVLDKSWISYAQDLRLTLESKAGMVSGELRLRNARWPVKAWPRFGGGISGVVQLTPTSRREFTLTPLENPSSHPPGAMSFTWHRGSVLVYRQPALARLRLPRWTTPREYRHPKGWFRCDIPPGWRAGDLSEALLLFDAAARRGDPWPRVFLLFAKQTAAARGKSPLERLKEELRELGATADSMGVTLEKPPRLRQVAVDGWPAALARWRATGGSGEALRVWTALVAHKGFELVFVMIYRESEAKKCEEQAAVVTNSLRVLDPPR